MLLNYKVENYRSFGMEQSLSMKAGPVRNLPRHVVETGGVRALCTAALFGAGSAGKSNLVRSMRESRGLVVHGIPIPVSSWSRGDEGNALRPTGFEYEFTAEGRRMAYGFEVLARTGEVCAEWLYDITSGDDVVFDRDGDGNISTSYGDDPDLDAFAVVARACGDHGLMLPLMASYSAADGDLFSLSAAAFSWFRDCLVVAGPGEPLAVTNGGDRSSIVADVLTSYMEDAEDVVQEPVDIDRVLASPGAMDVIRQRADVSVIDIDGSRCTVRRDEEGDLVAERSMVVRGSRRTPFSEESDGSRRILDLVPLLDPGEGKGKVYVVDEFDRSLHPIITYKMLEDFHIICAGLERQLVMVTHDVGLLDYNKLRRDEMWFVDRRGGDSRLYSLESYRERGDKRIDLAYLAGRYGGVPWPVNIPSGRDGGA